MLCNCFKRYDMKVKKIRESNLEILRILCIIFIIGDHFVGQSGVIETSNLVLSFFYCAVTSLSRVACSVFIIISAWFSTEKPFRIKRVIHTWLTVIMYTVPITLYCMYWGGASKENLFYAFLPIEGSPLWFAGYYMVLVLLSPVLNWLINEAPKQIVEWLLLVLFCLMVIFSTATANLGFFAHDIWPLLFLYLTTGYIKKYKPVPESKKCLLIFGSLWFFLTFLRAYVMGKSGSNLSIYAMIRDYCEIYRARLQTLPNLLMAYSIFFYFYAIKVAPSRIINTLAGTTLGIYCFHQVPVWYSYLWTNIFQSTKYVEELHGYKRAIYTLIVIFLVWGIGTALELIRSRISKILIEDRKYYDNFCNAIDKLVNYEDDANVNIQKKNIRWHKQIIIITFCFFVIVKFITI